MPTLTKEKFASKNKNSSKNDQKLKNIRQEIDLTNKKLSDLLEKRLSLALKALPYKKKILDKKREKEILAKIPSPYLKAIFKQILISTKKEQVKAQKNQKNKSKNEKKFPSKLLQLLS